MLQDLRFALKLLLKQKAFTLTALLTLALCIGANTAIFTVLKSVILDPLALPDPNRLVKLYNIYPGVGVNQGSNSVPDYLDRRQLADVFDSVALMENAGYNVGAEGSPQRVDGQRVTPSYFQVLRVAPLLGRTFTVQEAAPGNDKFAVLSTGLWKDLFAGDPLVLGKDVRLSGVPYRIIGVMPAGFTTPGRETRIWVPMAFTAEQTSDDSRHNNNWDMIARLRPGVTRAYAQRRIDDLNRQNLERFPKFRKILTEARFGTVVAGLKDELVKDARPTLYLLQTAAGLVLLIGCVNISGLLLVRSNVRGKEIALRCSLGASRARIARQLLTEGVVLAGLGGICGLLVAWGGIQVLSQLGARELPRGQNLAMDPAVFGFSAAASLLSGLIFAAVPAINVFRGNLHEIFRGSERTGTVSPGAMRMRSVLVVAQISLAFVLLIGAGLLTLSFVRLLAVKPGFRSENVLTARFSLPRSRYTDDAAVRSFIDGLLRTIRTAPGVEAAGAATLLPFGGNNNASAIQIVGRPLGPAELPPVPAWNTIDAGYFAALGIPVLQGRTFSDADTVEAAPVVVIDQFLARKYFPRGDAIGHQIRRGIDDRAGAPATIVGVVGSVKTSDLAEQNPVGQIYFHYKQYSQFVNRGMYLVAKSNGLPLAGMVRERLRQADPELPLFDVKTMPQRLDASVMNRRAAMLLCLIFAGLAVLLAAVGLYGVLAYSVTERTREFGIRVALGAKGQDVLAMVLGHGCGLAVAGLVIGLAAAAALTRLMSALLYDVRPTNPAVMAGVALLLLVVALVASLAPAVRAVRIQPAIALRHE